jgi:uncharacterized repeat protein (TIGR03847 family)
VVIAQELVDDDPDSPDSEEEPGEARMAITRDQAEAFVDGARELVVSGRPLCRLCGGPIDPEGHACPRWN